MQYSWDYVFSLVKNYRRRYGSVKIDKNFRTKNGYDYDENGIYLGEWLSRQKTKHKQGKLMSYQIEKLKALGVDFQNTHAIRWQIGYVLAKHYYQHYGHLKIEQTFRTTNGYDYDPDGHRLGAWVHKQRKDYQQKQLSCYRIKKLEEIGMIFENVVEDQWNKVYQIAKAYYEHHGHLKMNRSFKTKDGITYDETGYCLATWLMTQRKLYRKGQLSNERLAKLELIGFIAHLKQNIESNVELCNHHGIDYLSNKQNIDAIAHRELSAKINYLNKQGLPLMCDGQLHPIFYMGNMNMQVRYGIDLETLLTEYSLNNEKIKMI